LSFLLDGSSLVQPFLPYTIGLSRSCLSFLKKKKRKEEKDKQNFSEKEDKINAKFILVGWSVCVEFVMKPYYVCFLIFYVFFGKQLQ